MGSDVVNVGCGLIIVPLNSLWFVLAGARRLRLLKKVLFFRKTSTPPFLSHRIYREVPFPSEAPLVRELLTFTSCLRRKQCVLKWRVTGRGRTGSSPGSRGKKPCCVRRDHESHHCPSWGLATECGI